MVQGSLGAWSKADDLLVSRPSENILNRRRRADCRNEGGLTPKQKQEWQGSDRDRGRGDTTIVTVVVDCHREVVVGDLVGSGEGQEHDVVGETPNLAARLQAIAEPNTVVIAEAARRLLDDLFELRDLGLRELKGIAGH